MGFIDLSDLDWFHYEKMYPITGLLIYILKHRQSLKYSVLSVYNPETDDPIVLAKSDNIKDCQELIQILDKLNT